MTNIRIQSSDIIRLIQHHLLDCGLYETFSTLQSESGLGLTSSPSASMKSLSSSGKWGDVLVGISRLDESVRRKLPDGLEGEVREMAVTELIDSGDNELARLVMRECGDGNITFSTEIRRVLENTSNSMAGVDMTSIYGVNETRQSRRDKIGKTLDKYIPISPDNRLVTLLNQSLKWEAHTGTLPTTSNNSNNSSSSNRDNDIEDFDIVLGSPPQHIQSSNTPIEITQNQIDKHPTRQSSPGLIKYGKKNTPNCITFLPDGNGVVTGSTDGFVEVYDYSTCKLRGDLIYQKNEEFILHPTSVLSLAYSRDGEMLGTGDKNGCVKVWGLSSGKCLRSFDTAHSSGVLCLVFGKDGSKLLSGGEDGVAREFGLRSSNMVQEFRGHSSYVNTIDVICEETYVATASADATVKIWSRSSGECIKTIALPSPSGAANNSIPIHTLITIDDGKSFIVIPRAATAYLIHRESGEIQQTYASEKIGGASNFVTACTSPTERFLYVVSEDNMMYCFDVKSGVMEKALIVGESQGTEIGGVCCHPNKNVVATVGCEGGKGKVKFWVN